MYSNTRILQNDEALRSLGNTILNKPTRIATFEHLDVMGGLAWCWQHCGLRAINKMWQDHSVKVRSLGRHETGEERQDWCYIVLSVISPLSTTDSRMAGTKPLPRYQYNNCQSMPIIFLQPHPLLSLPSPFITTRKFKLICLVCVLGSLLCSRLSNSKNNLLSYFCFINIWDFKLI